MQPLWTCYPQLKSIHPIQWKPVTSTSFPTKGKGKKVTFDDYTKGPEKTFDKSSVQISHLACKTWFSRYPRCWYLIHDIGTEFKLHFHAICIIMPSRPWEARLAEQQLSRVPPQQPATRTAAPAPMTTTTTMVTIYPGPSRPPLRPNLPLNKIIGSRTWTFSKHAYTLSMQ